MAVRMRLSATATRILILVIISASTVVLLLNVLLTVGHPHSILVEAREAPDLKAPDQAGDNAVVPIVLTETEVVPPSGNNATTTAPLTKGEGGNTTTIKKVLRNPRAYDWTSIRYVQEEPDLCRLWRPDIYALIYVHTAPTHFKQRALIRRTYGDNRLYERLRHVTVFFVGRAEDERVAHALALESQRYRDIVQVDYMDTYRNLSIKALAAFAWITKRCPHATYVIKVDDDVFINVFNLIRHLRVLAAHASWQDSIHGLVWDGMIVLRETNSKWYVSPEEFPASVYPRYCSGSAYFMRTHLADRLLDASLRANFLWVDDAYVTGVLAGEANVTHHSIQSIVSVTEEDYDKKLIEGECVFGHMAKDPGLDMRHKYWQKLLTKEEWTG